jgi:hypothetical protein
MTCYFFEKEKLIAVLQEKHSDLEKHHQQYVPGAIGLSASLSDQQWLKAPATGYLINDFSGF